ncbi:MAG: hypothetical protein RLZZ312_1036 [Bacteroidota bacterium]|jgi:hypothetical protein
MFVVISRYLIPKGFAGLTLFPFIIFRNKYYSTNKTTLNHEKIHIRQQAELLVLPFYLFYFLDFLRQYLKYKNGFLAYKNIVFEREAYANESDLSYLRQRKFFGFWIYF